MLSQVESYILLNLGVNKVGLWFYGSSYKPLNVLMDRVKHHDLYLSAGCCPCAVNVILKPLYPLFEDLQYSGSHASLPALKPHYQELSRVSITHNLFSFRFFFFFVFAFIEELYVHWKLFKLTKQSAKCLNRAPLTQWIVDKSQREMCLCCPRSSFINHLCTRKKRLDNEQHHNGLCIGMWNIFACKLETFFFPT